MAKQGRWILKNVRHNRPGVTIEGVSLSRQGNTLNIGSVTSQKRDTINTEWYTNLGVNIDVNSLIKNPAENSYIEYGGLRYKVKWELTEKPITPEPGYINISRNSIDALCENNSLFLITVNANVDWTVEVSQAAQSWLSVQDITDNSFKVKILNSTSNRRTGTITVKSVEAGEAPSKTITVTQPDCRPEEPSIDIDVTSINAECDGNQEYDVSVTAKNTEWTVEVTQGSSWITITNKTDTGFTINIADSTSASRNGTVSVKSTTAGVNITKTISVSQPDCRPEEPSIDINVSNINAVCEGNQARTVTVTAKNTDWDVEVTQGDSWITISNKTSNSFLVNIADSTVGERSGSIKVKSTTQGVSITKTISVTQPDCKPEEPSIDINIYEINAACKSNQPKVITVTAKNTEWDIEIIQEGNWITISNRTSNGFTVNVADSTVGPRSGSIKVKSTTPGVNITKTITITQPDCTPVPDSITINPDSWTIPCDVSDDTRYHFNITTNVEWGFDGDVETTYDWIHIVETGETYFELKFEKNDAPDADERRAYISITGGTARATVSILQNKCEDVPPVQETINITTNDFEVPCETDETYTISVNASTGWTATTIAEWINITAITSDSIKITVSDNPGGDRDGVITAYTIEGGTMASDTITITQRECEDIETFDVDTSDIHFECNDDMHSLQINATDGVTWTAATSDNRFGVYLGSENPSQEVTGTGTETLHIIPLTDNRNVRYDIEGTLRIQSSLGDDVTINLSQAPTPVLEYEGQTQLQFSKTGETKTLTFKTNFDVNVSISQSTNWLSYTKGNLGSTADDGLQIEFSANENPTESQLSATVTISTAYDGNCEKPSNIVIYMYQEEGDPYIPPQPGAYFEVMELYGDFPYYAELGGFTHERSFMDDAYYERCSDLTGGNIGGVVYLMPVRACAIQVYYDTNVDINGLTYEIEHITPANPSQEWLEVVMKPEEYGCMEEYPEMECGWSEVDSRGEPYPDDFILIKTRDNFDGSHLYEETYTGYVHIKEKATGNVLCSIPVKCIAVDIGDESVKVSATENTRDLEKNLKIGSESSPAVGAAGGFVDVWVYTNDSAYISDYIPGIFIADDNDVNWNKLSFYYPDDTRMPVVPAQDPMGYIDKIYDTTCNDNGLQLLRVYVAPNYSFNDAVTHGFHVRTENAGFKIFDGGNNAQVRIVQDRDHETYRNNYRIVEFYSDDGGITPVVDETVTDISQISGGTCDGSGHSTHPFFKAIYDYGRASSPGTVYTAETMNDNMIIYDEQAGHDILNPNVLEVTNITYQGGSGWVDVNQNYTPIKNQPFEFYIKPNTGYTAGGSSRKASITITYKNCSPQISRTLEITQSYKQVEPATFGVYLWATNSQGDRVGNDVEATVTPNSNKEFTFEILTSSNAEGYVMPYVGDNPEPQYYDGIQNYVSAVSSLTYYAQDFDFNTAISLYMSGGIEFPEVANKGSYKIKTYGQAFDLKLLCKDKNDPQVQRILTIHVNAC